MRIAIFILFWALLVPTVANAHDAPALPQVVRLAVPPITIDSCEYQIFDNYWSVTFEPSMEHLGVQRVHFDVRYWGHTGWLDTEGNYTFGIYTETLLLHGYAPPNQPALRRMMIFHRARLQCRVSRVYFKNGTEWIGPGRWSPASYEK